MRTRILITTAIVTAFVGGVTIWGHVRRSLQNDPSQAYAVGPAPVTQGTPQQTSTGYNAQPAPAQASVPAETGNYEASVPSQAMAPAHAREPSQAVDSASEPAYRPQTVRHRRTLRRQALIVGGSAAAGSAIGAAAGGGKGATVGAVSGGVAGLVYDLLTKNR